MLLKARKHISILLAVILFCLSSNTSFAATSENTNNDTINQNTVTKRVHVSEVSMDAQKILDSVNMVLTKDSLIDIVSIDSESDGTAMVITSIQDSLITKDVIIAIDENGKVMDFEAYEKAQVSSRAGGSANYNYDNKITIRATAVYNQRSYENTIFSYYQPIGMYFTYSKEQSCSVSSIQTTYKCVGFEHTYPGMVDLGEELYTYDIRVFQSSPAANTVYHTVDEYRDDRVIYTGSGHFDVGNYIFFLCMVDGQVGSWQVRI